MAGQPGGDGGQAHKVVVVQWHNVARLPRRIGYRRHEVKPHRLPNAQCKGAPGQRYFGAGGDAAWQHANALRHTARRLGQAQKVAAGRTTTYAPAQLRHRTGAHQRIGHGTACHRHIGRVVVQHAQGLTAPVGQQLFHPLCQRRCVEHTAVEQQGVGQVLLPAVLGQEQRQMACDGRIGGVGQAQGHNACLALFGPRVQGFAREKAFYQPPLHVGLCQFQRAGLAHQAGTAAQQGDIDAGWSVVGQELFLGHAAALHQLGKARCWQGGGELELAFGPVCQRQVHVVAAQHQVVAHADAGQLWPLWRVFHLNQRQVGGAAAHIAHQQPLGVGQFGGQLVAVAEQPVVERCLGFF